MIITTYKCDRCEAEQSDAEQMWNVGVYVEHYPATKLFSPYKTNGKQLWCRKCVEDMQLLGKPVVPKTEEPPKPVCLDDKIAEIVCIEVEKLIGGSK